MSYFFQKKYKELAIPTPYLHFVLGSLIGEDLAQTAELFPKWEYRGQISFGEIPDLNTASAPSHQGCYQYFYHKKYDKSLCFQLGRLHGYEGLSPSAVVKTVTEPCKAGTSHFILTNISGGLKKQWKPGFVIAVKDHINFTGASPLTGFSRTDLKNFYFLDMETAYHQKLTQHFAQIMKNKKNLSVADGVYIGVSGPQLETPQEIKLFASWGADVVGMSTIWEVIALNYLKANVSAFSIVSNPACGIGSSTEIKPSCLKKYFKAVLESFFLIDLSKKTIF